MRDRQKFIVWECTEVVSSVFLTMGLPDQKHFDAEQKNSSVAW